jgi:PhnB protein
MGCAGSGSGVTAARRRRLNTRQLTQTTMATMCPFVRFNDGKCREAMEFYKGIFGGEVQYMTVGETPMANDIAEDRRGYIMHAELKTPTLKFFGSDMFRDKAVIGDHVGIALECASEAELREHFAKLAEGGEVFSQPEDMFWGAIFGMVTDRYGVEWMLNYQKTLAKG